MATAIFDALPYYDNDLEVHPDLKPKVEKELAREGKPPTTLHPKVPPPIDLFSVGTSTIRSESFLNIQRVFSNARYWRQNWPALKRTGPSHP